jgi:hypothetical protein
LALRGHFSGPVAVQNAYEKDLIIAENSRRSLVKGDAVEWYLENVFVKPTHKTSKKNKHASGHECLNKLCALTEGVSPGKANVDFEQMLPPVIKSGSDVPMEIIKVDKGGISTLVEVVHRDKIHELSKMVKFCKDPWNYSLQQQLMQVQVQMESAGYKADGSVQAAVLDLAITAGKEGLMGTIGPSVNGRNVRQAWCNVMNSFLRKDERMFTTSMRVLLYHLESGN